MGVGVVKRGQIYSSFAHVKQNKLSAGVGSCTFITVVYRLLSASITSLLVCEHRLETNSEFRMI